MNRRLVILLTAVVVVLMLAIGGPAAAQTGGSSAKKPLGQKYAQHLLAKKKFPRAVKATRKVLALSGVATVREAEQIVAPVAPVSKWKMTALETVLLTRGFRNRQVQLGTLAKTLGDAGVKIGGRSATQVLPELVGSWMMNSEWQTGNPLNQPAIFLMHAQTGKAGGFWTPFADQSTMWLSSLEAIVVLANFERLLRPGTASSERSSTSATAAAEGGPCASVSEGLKSLGPVGEGVAQAVIGDATGSALQGYADSIKEGSGEAIGKLMTSLDLSDRILRTAAFSEHVVVDVVADGKGLKDGRMHKSHNDREPVWFEGTVGLSKKARKELDEQLKWAKDHAFQESIRNCASLHGITIPRPYGDLAEEMAGEKSKWSAYWTLERPSPDGVRWYGPRRTKLKKVDIASAKSRFKISIPQENPKARKPKFGWDPVIATQDARVTMEVAAQKPPSPISIGKFIVAVGTGGAKFDDFVGPIAELAEGLIRTSFKPTGHGTLTIEEHAPHPCAGRASAAGPRAQPSC
ncbi:MAG TPA: hypothetical protein VD790_00285 [Thermoleophilaceae bacterium]|nr:hypothetical protein [Thermoleophilaceae bacterium]